MTIAFQHQERPFLRWFFEHFAYDVTRAAQVTEHAKTPLTIPVRAWGGASCLGPLTLTSVKAVAPAAEGGVIERCGHWAAEERPELVADLVKELAKLAR